MDTSSPNFNVPESSLKVTAQAGRPVLGDFLQITLFSEGDYEPLITFVLQKIADLERALDLEDPKSEISKLINLRGDDTSEISIVVGEVMEEALALSILSAGAFEPFREGSKNWEMRGLIRGYIVDQTVKYLLQQEPFLMGVIHLAEGMRFFNCPKKSIHVRMGDAKSEKEVGLFKDAIATTEARGSLFDQESTTVYLQPLRHGVTGKHTVSAIADDCLSANVLTYVGLFADAQTVQECVNELKAQVIVFDDSGEISEIFEGDLQSKAYSSDPLRTSSPFYDGSSKDSSN